MNCKCRFKNGSDVLDFLTSVPGGTAADATYEIGLTHYSCGNRQMLLNNSTHPVIAQLTAEPVGTPIDLGNDTYCQECQIAGTVTYCPCNSCSPQVEYVSQRVCLPCSSAYTYHRHGSRFSEAYHGVYEQRMLRMLSEYQALHEPDCDYYKY